MSRKRKYTKAELKRMFSNLKEKGITDGMAHILLDETYNEPVIRRTSGFGVPGASDAEMEWNDATRTLTLAPVDPAEDETVYDESGKVYVPHFRFYTWKRGPVLQRHYAYNTESELPNADAVELPNEEGLFAIYYDLNAERRRYELTYLKNPTVAEIAEIYMVKVIVSCIYWDASNAEAVYFGDERHGSEWNPQIHWWAHGAFNALWKSGLHHNGVVIGDGSLNGHAQFGINSGEFYHEDMEHAITGVSSTTGLPVLWFDGSYPRIELNAGYSFLKGTSFLYYNGSGAKAEVTDGYFMLYHVFATNCQLYPLISVMGQSQYENKNTCCKAALEEVKALQAQIPQQTALPLVSFAFEINSEFTNTPKTRIVQPCTGQSALIWIEEYDNWYDIQIQIELYELKANQPKADEAVLTSGANNITFTEAFSVGTEYVLWVYTYDDSGYQVGNSVSSETVSGFTVTVPKACNLKYTATVKN
jgi:hypothetical protein